MIELPRIALGTVQPHLNLQDLLWGLLEGLRRAGVETQVFSSQSRFDDLGSLRCIDDRRLRHLDSWLMSPEISRWFLFDGGQERDLSIIVGRFERTGRELEEGGSLVQLCDTLQVPAVVVLDVATLDPCGLPQFPPGVAALLCVGCKGSEDLARWQTRLETLRNVSVVGGLCDQGEPPPADRHGTRNAAPESGRIQKLGDDVERHVPYGRILQMARNAAPLVVRDPWQTWPKRTRPLRVAVAYDEVFNCYFPDTMDCLELMGAELIDFSPLKSECLPEAVDLVWLGCGHVERCPERLSRNICLRQSLQAYVRAGGRVYAEGGGLAYICETMRCDSGTHTMAGLLPAEACYVPGDTRPVDLCLVGNPWIGRQRVRGYLNRYWVLTARDACVDYTARSSCPLSLVGTHGVIGSRIHLHFASQPQLLRSIWSSGRAC